MCGTDVLTSAHLVRRYVNQASSQPASHRTSANSNRVEHTGRLRIRLSTRRHPATWLNDVSIVYCSESHWDLAVLRIDAVPMGVTLPRPAEISGTPPRVGTPVNVIGHGTFGPFSGMSFPKKGVSHSISEKNWPRGVPMVFWHGASTPLESPCSFTDRHVFTEATLGTPALFCQERK